MNNIITKFCSFLKKETDDFGHTIHISKNTSTIENKDLAQMLNYTNDMVTTIHDIIKKPKRIPATIEGFHLYSTKKQINMNKIKITETNNIEEEYDIMIYEAYKELEHKHLKGLLNASELQSYYDKHTLIINFFKQESDNESNIISDEENYIEEQQSLLVAGVEEAESSVASGMDYQSLAQQQQQQQYNEYLKKLADEIQTAQLQKQQLDRQNQENYTRFLELQNQLKEATKRGKQPKEYPQDTFNPLSLTNVPMQYLNIDNITKKETLRKVLTNWGQHAIGMIPILAHFDYHEFGAYIVSLWEGRALRWLKNFMTTHETEYVNMFKESRKNAIFALCNKLYLDLTGYDIEEIPRLEEKLSKIQLWDIQLIDEFTTKYFDLILELKENKIFWLTKIFDKIPYLLFSRGRACELSSCSPFISLFLKFIKKR